MLYQGAANHIKPEPGTIPDRWAVWFYLITGVSMVIIDLLVGSGGPALAEFFGMLPWVWLGFFNTSPAYRKETGAK